jgi:hypothetical protein
MITNPDPEYEMLSVELLFSRTLYLRGIGFNSYTFSV